MTNSDAKRDRWEKTRQMGRSRFVWLGGVCGVGISSGLLFSLVFWYFVSPRSPFWEVLGVALILFPCGGYVWGTMMWWLGERWYQHAMKKRTAESDSTSEV